MRSGSRFQLNALCLIALIAGLAFSTPAQAGLFGRCGGLFGRRAQANQCSSGYAVQGFQTANQCSSGYAVQGYQTYQYQTAAPCAPCGQAAPPMPTYAPAQPLPTAPQINSTPLGYRTRAVPRVTCVDGSCRLR